MTETKGGRLSGRVALVTGASRGIGAAVAKRFAAEGAHVICVARTKGGLEETDDAIRAAGGSATLVPLDVTQGDRVDQLGAAIAERFKRLDILASVAGSLGILSPVAHVDPKVWARAFDVNVTANYRLIRALDPFLRASDAGRAIFVTSAAARRVRAYWGPYAASKAALESMVLTYAAEVGMTPLRVNLLDPGAVATAMRKDAYPGEDRSKLKKPDDIAGAFVDLAEPACALHGELVKAQG